MRNKINSSTMSGVISKAIADGMIEADIAYKGMYGNDIEIEPVCSSVVRACETCENGSGEYFENHCCCQAWSYIGECHYVVLDSEVK